MDSKKSIPDSTAVRTALWRALHVEVDSAPHILEDEIGLQLVNPDRDWRARGDMHPQGTSGYRASIVARARYVEDLLQEQFAKGVRQYVVLGAGLDTFAERKTNLASKMQVFEVDQPGTQAWKKKRLEEIGFKSIPYLRFVPVDFEAGDSWWNKLNENGFDPNQPAVISSTGVSMYLTKEAIAATFRQVAKLAPGSTFAMTFMLTLDLLDPVERPQHEMVYKRAAEAGTPFLSFFTPEEIIALAKECGFKKAMVTGHKELTKLYFEGRSDGLKLATGEPILVAET